MLEVPPASAVAPIAAAPEEAPSEVTEPLSAAHARLGSEALGRLRGRYADVLANLSRRVSDEQRREQLREQAERLNPDSWVTDDEVTAGLEAYESVLASLREVVGRRRRRRRGRGGPEAANTAQSETADGHSAPDADTQSGDGEDDGETGD